MPRLSFADTSQIDSLLNVLENQEDTSRMKTLRHITKRYMNNSVEEAIKYASELLMIAEEAGNLKYIDLACSFLGEAYFYMDEIEKSIEYFEKYLETNVKQEDIDGIGTAYNNLGIVYRYIEKYETAIQYYLESLAIKEKLKDSIGLSSTLNNIGVLYFHMSDYNKALEYYNRSYTLETKLNNKPGIATSLLNIGEIHSMLNDYDKALSHFNRSIELSEIIEDNHTIEINYKCMYDMYKRKIDFQKALYYYELYTELRNNRLSQESRIEIAELEIQYETSKKEKEIKLLNKQNILGRIIIIGLSIAFVIFIFLLILLYIQGKAKKRALNLLSINNVKITEQTEVLNRLNTTKDKFFSIISHDLKGAIGGFLSQTEFLATDFKDLPQEDMLDLIIKMNQSSEQLYSLLENLLEWSKSQTGSIKIQPEKFKLKKLIDNILLLFKELMEEKKIKSNVKVSANMEVFADINMVSTVFRNLVVNAIKFSHPESTFNIIATNMNGFVQIEVSDQGIGITKKDQQKLFNIDQSFSNPGTNSEKGSGLGLIICKEFIELNQGKIWVESELGRGSRFIFTLKSV
ncbi:tetratricopeptide repeat protein [Bacteroidota bacterium]